MFTDVGKVNIKVIDTNWSKVDIDHDDTPLDCSPNGAYLCGEVNATYIPDHFTLTAANVFNSNGSTYTYLANDLNNMSAGISLTITAENFLNAPTVNFHTNAWEKPVDIRLVIPSALGLTSNPDDINETLNLGFINGARNINFNDNNTSENLIFNYDRNTSIPVNPFVVDGADINLTANSVYTPTVGNATTIVSPTVNPNQNVTFIYGRTYAPRQRFVDENGTALIYYEAYCSGTENGRACDKSLLPGLGLNARFNDDFRWFVNDAEDGTQSSIGDVTQKNATTLTINAATAGNPTSVPLEYDETKGYPYKTTMENNASTWLLYHRYTPNAPSNEFEVEFTNSNSSWAGQSESENTTKKKASNLTNRRSMW